MKKIIYYVFFLSAVFLFQTSSATATMFMDDRLEIVGDLHQTAAIRTHRDARDIQFTSFRTTLRLEALYDAVTKPELDINFYVLTSYYYDWVLDVDSHMRRAIRVEAGGNHKYRDYRRPRSGEEFIKELYVDIKYKNFQLRLGKQMVSWGETAMTRVADVINPLDYKYFIAYPEWEDYKLGLWMARMFWRPDNMWQDLTFELIVIPFDFEENHNPVLGVPGIVPPSSDHTMQKMFSKMSRDAPHDGLDMLEFGFRIRGYADVLEGIDWTLSYFYTRADTPLFDGLDGFNNLLPIFFGGVPSGKVYEYPRYSSTAFTFSTTWDPLKLTIAGECAYNTDVDYQYGASLPTAYKQKDKDIIATALTVSRKFQVPFLSNNEFLKTRRDSLTFSLTWYHWKLLNHEYDKSTGEYVMWNGAKRDSSNDTFSIYASMNLFYTKLIPVIQGNYDVNGSVNTTYVLVYMPGDRIQYAATYVKYYEVSKLSRMNDQVVLSIRYEF